MLYHTFSTQQEIDREYNPRFIVENTEELIKRFFSESQRVLREYSNFSSVAYGPSTAETLDIFPAARPCSPVHIFFHGGYWHAFMSEDFAFVAEGQVRNGVTTVLVNYGLCPLVDIDEIVRQSRSAVAWVYQNIETFGGNPDRITVSGHSAGGHLTGMLLNTDWERDYDLPQNLIKGFLSLSGLFDLKPFPFSWLQSKLQLTPEQVSRNSPVLLKPKYKPPFIVAVGSDESHEFHRQSKNYAHFLEGQEVPAVYSIIPEKNHFNILFDFLGEGGPLCKKILEW